MSKSVGATPDSSVLDAQESPSEGMRPTSGFVLIPLTLIAMTTLSKWWYVLPVDAPDTMMLGWPLPFACDGWHTSLSHQVFFAELALDAACYLGLIALLMYALQRWLRARVRKGLLVGLWVVAALAMVVPILQVVLPDNVYYLHRDWELQVIDSGPELLYAPHARPEFPEHLRP